MTEKTDPENLHVRCSGIADICAVAVNIRRIPVTGTEQLDES